MFERLRWRAPIWAACLILAGCAAAPRSAEMASPARAVTDEARRPGTIVVAVDTGGKPLGAYELVIHFDADSVRLVQVDGIRGGFPAEPVTDPKMYATGATPVLGFHIAGYRRGGAIPVAQLAFDGNPGASSTLSVSVRALYTPEGEPINGTVTLSASRVRLP